MIPHYAKTVNHNRAHETVATPFKISPYKKWRVKARKHKNLIALTTPVICNHQRFGMKIMLRPKRHVDYFLPKMRNISDEDISLKLEY